MACLQIRSVATLSWIFYVRRRDEEVRQMLQKMVRVVNYYQTKITYDRLVNVLAKHGHGDEALEF